MRSNLGDNDYSVSNWTISVTINGCILYAWWDEIFKKISTLWASRKRFISS